MRSTYCLLALSLSIPAASAVAQRTFLVDFGRLEDADMNPLVTDPNGAERWNDAAKGPGNFQVIDGFPTLTGLIDTNGNASSYSLDLVGTVDFPLVEDIRLGAGGFDDTGNTGLPYVGTAAGDTFFLNGETTADFAITGLDNTKSYGLNFYGYVSDNRRVQNWVVTGTGTQTATLDPSFNTTTVASLTGLSPAGGSLGINWSTDPNTPGFQNGQWNVLEIIEAGGPTVQIDFGRDDQETPGNWNNISSVPNPAFGSVEDFPNVADLIDTSGAATGFGFELVNATSDEPKNGVGVGIGGAVIDPAQVLFNTGRPVTADQDTLILPAEGAGTVASFELAGLRTDGTTYDLTMFGSIGDFRTLTKFTVDGTEQTFDPSFNTGTTVDFSEVAPDANGVITIEMSTEIPTGSTDFDAGHWNWLQVVENAVAGITGDYDSSGQVEQGDLDIVLQNWGTGTFTGDEAALVGGGPFDGTVDQNELDGVLQNWGSTSAPDFTGSALPEPAAFAALAVVGLLSGRRAA